MRPINIVVSIILIVGSSVCWSRVSYIPPEGTAAGAITISQTIDKGDASKFETLVSFAKRDALYTHLFVVNLNSRGGSVEEAIAIGRTIRSIPLDWYVPLRVVSNYKCISACVLILAGGNIRYVEPGTIGIHRPYIDDDESLTVESQKQSYSAMERKIKQYLSEMNVPTSLFDLMFRIPPESVKFLTTDEMQSFNLNEWDPFYKEAHDAQFAKEAGISKTEFFRRKRACNALLVESEQIRCLQNISNPVFNW